MSKGAVNIKEIVFSELLRSTPEQADCTVTARSMLCAAEGKPVGPDRRPSLMPTIATENEASAPSHSELPPGPGALSFAANLID